jgi:hypothetical protein
MVPEGFSSTFEVTVSDLTGKQLLSRRCNTAGDRDFDVSWLASGTYHVTIICDTLKVVRKLIIL